MADHAAMMNILGRALVLSALPIVATALVACTAGVAPNRDGAPSSATVATPLLQACDGEYACTVDGESGATAAQLRRSSDGGVCAAGGLVFASDRTVTDTSNKKLGTWWGDSLEFAICADDGCMLCKNVMAPAPSPSSPAPKTGACTGDTTCTGRSAVDCLSLQGCELHSHAVYKDGAIAYWVSTCSGSTPSCSEHDNEDECRRQECEWQ